MLKVTHYKITLLAVDVLRGLGWQRRVAFPEKVTVWIWTRRKQILEKEWRWIDVTGL